MQTSHVISDLFLVVTCLWVLYQCWKQHGQPLVLVWGLFFGSVGLAAFFGAMRFADVHPSMVDLSQFFQKIASTFGSCGLVAGVCWLFKPYAALPLITLTILGGTACFLTGLLLGSPSFFSILQMIAMLAVMVIAVVYWFRRLQREHRTIAWRLMLAIVFSALATISLRALPYPNSIDAFHYLLGVGMLCFGWAAMGSGTHTSIKPQIVG